MSVWRSFNPSFQVGKRKVGGDAPCFVIAEAGVSHFGDLGKAFQLIEVAARAKADAVKFQHFFVEEMISSECKEWVERMRPKQLTIDDFAKLKKRCDELGIIFFASAHDERALIELAELGMPCFKVGSGELQNSRYYELICSFGKPVIASTGMHEQVDIESMLVAAQKSGCRDLSLLHCVTQYPTPPEHCNLKMVQTLARDFSGPVGYSDHSPTQDVAAASAVLGAKVIERHITLEKNIPNAQDWKVSCMPDELVEFVWSIRRLEAATGDGRYRVQEGAKKSIEWARKSIVASRDLEPGTRITQADVTFKRPGTGISPQRIDEILGRMTKTFIARDTILKEEMLG